MKPSRGPLPAYYRVKDDMFDVLVPPGGTVHAEGPSISVAYLDGQPVVRIRGQGKAIVLDPEGKPVAMRTNQIEPVVPMADALRGVLRQDAIRTRVWHLALIGLLGLVFLALNEHFRWIPW